jgi:hypothetical protein
MIFSSQFADNPVTDIFPREEKKLQTLINLISWTFKFRVIFLRDFDQLHSGAKFEPLLSWSNHTFRDA